MKQLNFSFLFGHMGTPAGGPAQAGANFEPASKAEQQSARGKKRVITTPTSEKTVRAVPLTDPSFTSQPLAPLPSHHQSLDSIWQGLIEDFFPDRVDLLDYRLVWSGRRQKRTLATCNLKSRKISVAQEMNHPDYGCYLEPLIYHELCHAVLGYSVRSASGKSRWHGKEFRALERQHPRIKDLNAWIKAGGWRQAVRRHRSRLSPKKLVTIKTIRRHSIITRFLRKLSLP